MNKELLYSSLLDWYDRNKRILPWRETCDPYRIWVSEIILQQTRVAQGLSYYHRFIDRFPDVASLANAAESEVLLYWEGLGYYSRARNLHAAAKILAENRNKWCSIVENGAERCCTDGYAVYAFWRSLPGVGDYTAGAIASFAYDLPYPALDGNVYRVLSRLYDCDIAFDSSEGKKHFRKLAEELLYRDSPRLFNSALMELGALHCVPQSPDCTSCPIHAYCKAFAHHTVDVLPVRKPRSVLRDRYLCYTIYICRDKTTLLHYRTGNDIWKHLWEFPIQEFASFDDFSPCSSLSKEGVRCFELKHILSHQRLHARFVVKKVNVLPEIEDTIVVDLRDLDNYAFSRLTLKALERITGAI